MVGISSQIGHSQRRVSVEVFRLDEALEQVPTHRVQTLSMLLRKWFQANVARLQCNGLYTARRHRGCPACVLLCGGLAMIQGQIHLLLSPDLVHPPPIHLPMHQQHQHYTCINRLLLLHNINAPDIFDHHQPLSQLLHLNNRIVGYKSRKGPIRVRPDAPCIPLFLTLPSCPRLYCPATRHYVSTPTLRTSCHYHLNPRLRTSRPQY
jgi:hypothetical protein